MHNTSYLSVALMRRSFGVVVVVVVIRTIHTMRFRSVRLGDEASQFDRIDMPSLPRTLACGSTSQKSVRASSGHYNCVVQSSLSRYQVHTQSDSDEIDLCFFKPLTRIEISLAHRPLFLMYQPATTNANQRLACVVWTYIWPNTHTHTHILEDSNSTKTCCASTIAIESQCVSFPTHYTDSNIDISTQRSRITLLLLLLLLRIVVNVLQSRQHNIDPVQWCAQSNGSPSCPSS
jgi:hypothetical protein